MLYEDIYLSHESKERMKTARIIFGLILSISFIGAGCEPTSRPVRIPTKSRGDLDLSPFYTRFAPVKIDIMPLTELVPSGSSQRSRLKLYVSVLDAFDSQIKSPGVFRIELYEYVQRSAEPRGKRIAIWHDIDLTDPVTNDQYWNDFLRTYQFDLPLDQSGDQNYIVQATCLCPNGSRLTSNFTLRSPK